MEGFIGVVIGLLVGAVMAWGITSDITTSRMHAEAIAAQVAEWRVDATTGEVTFVYLTPQEIAARLEQQ